MPGTKPRRPSKVQDDCIAVTLGLPDPRILRQQELEDRFEVKVIHRRNEVGCSGCGRMTNGFLEGKTIKRMAYGYRNMYNFRMRILATKLGCGGRLSHSFT